MKSNKRNNDEKNTILVIGDSEQSKDIIKTLKVLDANIVWDNSFIKGLESISESIKCIVIIPPLPKASASKVCSLFRQHNLSHELPIFVVLPDNSSNKFERQLYKNGATAIFEWPSEKQHLPRLIMSTHDINLNHSRNTSDKILKKVIDNRLNAEGCFSGCNLIVNVIKSYVFMTGDVQAFWQLKLAQEIIANIPGVQAVYNRRTIIKGRKIKDQKISDDIRKIIKSFTSLKDSTLNITVNNGTVNISGTTEHRYEINRLKDIFAHIKGIRDLKLQFVSSKLLAKRDSTIASQISKQIKEFFPDKKIHVSVIGNVVVLRGHVQRLLTSLSIENLVLSQNGIKRVINKLFITDFKKRV